MSNHQSSKPIKVLILQLFTNLKMVGKVESNTFAWRFLVSNTECGGEMFSEIWPNCGSQKHASFFTWQIVNKLLKGSFTNERQPNSPEHEDCSGWQRRKTRLKWQMWPSPLNASERTSEQPPRCSLEEQSMLFLRLASLAISELAMLDLSMIAVALKPSWLVRIITVMPL